ncbi:MAG TPA: FtsX-like permease family protein [Lacipirellulaceae bacterium]
MSFWKIAWRNIQQRALASSLTALSMALGIAVMIAVIVIHSVTVRQFEENAQGYHVIIGGKGGALQLVMTTVYHVGQPLYPIPYSYYQKFTEGGEFADITEVAIPMCLGDSYEAPDGTHFRVVGTTPDLFDKLSYGSHRDGTPKQYEFEEGGRNFKTENFYEAVVGSVVAARSGLKLGDEINPTHGLGRDGHKHEGFKVVGILKPTGTANDRAVFINIEGFYLLEGHASTPDEEEQAANEESTDDGQVAQSSEQLHDDHHTHGAHQPLPLEQREVTSILVLCNSPLAPTVLEDAFNRENDPLAQSVAPAREVALLMNSIVGPVRVILLVLTVLIVIVAGVSILVSIYNSMSERSHDIAVMRALGASRGAVMAVILVESILLSLGGGFIGMLVGHGVIALASPYVLDRTGIALGLFEFDWQELVLIPGLIVLASLVGLLPALAAYKTDVAKALAGSR